ncbi:MAG: DUF4384 domain-containing protein, partial [Pseudomonadota bacterium]
DPRGDINLLYPSRAEDLQQRYQAQRPLRLPRAFGDESITISAPFGLEFLVALAFDKPPASLRRIAALNEIPFESTGRLGLDALLQEAEQLGAKRSLHLTSYGY